MIGFFKLFSASDEQMDYRVFVEFNIFFSRIVSSHCMTLFYFSFLIILHLSYRITFFNVHNSFSRIFTECDNKTYGLDCRESCGNCSNGEPCHHVDGNCQFGCDDGVFGLKCITGIALQQIYRVHIIFSFIS